MEPGALLLALLLSRSVCPSSTLHGQLHAVLAPKDSGTDRQTDDSGGNRLKETGAPSCEKSH